MQPQPHFMDVVVTKGPHSLTAHEINRPDSCLDKAEPEIGIKTTDNNIDFFLHPHARRGKADAFFESTNVSDANAFDTDTGDDGDDGLHIPASLRAPERSTVNDIWGPKGPPGQSRGPVAANHGPKTMDSVKECFDTWDSLAHLQWRSAVELGRSMIGCGWRPEESSRFFMRVGVVEDPFQDVVLMQEKQILVSNLSCGPAIASIHSSNLTI